MKKKVLLRAYTSGNLGDDLFIKAICERYPNSLFYLIGKKRYQCLFNFLPNLKYIPTDRCFNSVIYKLIEKIVNVYKPHSMQSYMNYLLLKYSKHVDINVLISGSYFINNTTDKKIIDIRIDFEREYFELCPYVIGVNFGPYKSDYFLNCFKELFSRARIISFRELDSLEKFKGLNNVQYAPDIVFSCNFDTLIINKKSNDYILISVCNYTDNKNELSNYISGLKKIITYLLQNNEKVVLLSMCEYQHDNELCLFICKELNDERIKMYSYPSISMDECIDLFRNSKNVIATRYHAMILGWIFKKRTLPIIYSQKMLNVINDIKFNDKYTFCNELNSFDYKSYYNENHYKNKSVDIKSMTTSSSMHFKLIDQLLD